MTSPHNREELTQAVAESTGWADLMRKLGVKASGGRRRTLQRTVTDYGIDASHFKKQSPWRKYSDTAIAEAVASSTTLREVAEKLGARLATGTLSHIGRRIEKAGIDVSHFPGLNRTQLELPFSREELTAAAASSTSLRATARLLGIPDDGKSRAALRRCLAELKIGTAHFLYARFTVPEDQLRAAVESSSSYADVMRALELPVDNASHRRLLRRTIELGIDTSHFKRRTKQVVRLVKPKRIAVEVFRILPEGSPRTSSDRLRRALDEVGVLYCCEFCGNTGEWRGNPITLQIDHVNGEWLDNRQENLRYLCPNCHATTATWCGANRGRKFA